jgi:hypothetical protein
MAEDVEELLVLFSANLWVSSSSEDMDIFITIRHYDEKGEEIMDTGQQGAPVPVAKGWLRVSHRELDEEKSLPYRPYHKHQRRLRFRAWRNCSSSGRDMADVNGIPKRSSDESRYSA